MTTSSESVVPLSALRHRILTVLHSCDPASNAHVSKPVPHTRRSDQPEPLMMKKPVPPLTTPYSSPVFSRFTDNAQQSSATSHAMSHSRNLYAHPPHHEWAFTARGRSNLAKTSHSPNPFFMHEFVSYAVTTESSTRNENCSQQRITTLSSSPIPIAIARSSLTRSSLSTSRCPPPSYPRRLHPHKHPKV